MKKIKKMKSTLAFVFTLIFAFMSLQWNVWAYSPPTGNPLSEDTKIVDVYINASSDSGYKAEDVQTLLENKLNGGNKAISNTTYRVLNASDIKVSSNQTSIDTTDISNWNVYDHYDSSTGAVYANGNLTGSNITPPASWIAKFGQPSVKRPYFAYSERYAYMNTASTIENFLSSGNTGNVAQLDRHIYSSVDASGKPAMTFVGYGVPGYGDFLYYPAASTAAKEVKFSVDSSYVNTHTLNGAGFLVNTGIDAATGYMSGYILYYSFKDATHVSNITLYKINANTTATQIHENGILNCVTTVTSTTPPTWTSLMDIDLSITPTSLVVNEKASSVSSYTQVMSVTGLSSAYQGFGPIVQYNSHSCNICSMFKFSNLEMAFAEQTGSVLDSLSKSNFLTRSEKYFVNLQGKAGDATLNSADWDGITRIRKDQINYVTNVTNPFLSDGGINTTDATAPLASNGKTIANATSADDLATKIANYILGNYGYTQPTAQLVASNPIAIYTLVANPESTTDTQVIKVNGNLINSNMAVYTKDSSEAPTGKTLQTYRYLITDPNATSTVVTRTTPADAANPLMVLSANSVPGEYTVELTVTDSSGAVSNPATTTFTFAADTTAPVISLSSPSNITTAYTGNTMTYSMADAGDGVMAYSYTYNGNFTYNGTVYTNQTVTTPEINLGTAVASKTVTSEAIPSGVYALTITAYDVNGNKATKTFNVSNIIDLSTAGTNVTLGYTNTTYDGTQKTPSVTAQLGGKVLTAGTDYNVTFSNNTNAGTATVKVDGCGNYMGSVTKTFTISKATLLVTPDAGQSKYVGQADAGLKYTYTGNITGEIPGFTGALSRTSGEGVGSYTINQGNLTIADNGTFKAANYNYSFNRTSVSFAISQRAPVLNGSYKIDGTYNASSGWYTSAVVLSPMGSFNQILNGATWANSITINNQTQNIGIQLKDSTTGEISTTLASLTIRSDSVTPTIEVANVPTTWVKSVILPITATSGISGIKSVTANGVDITATFNNGYQVTANGTYTFTVTSNAGLSATKTVEITQIDNATPSEPVINLSGQYTDANWYNTDQTISATFTAGKGSKEKLQYSIDGGKTWTDGASAVVSSEGATTVIFRVMDEAGNVSANTSVIVKIDKTAPEVANINVEGKDFNSFTTGVSFDEFFSNQITAAVTGNDKLSGVKTIEYQKVSKESQYNPSGTWVAGSSLIAKPDDSFIIYARITDNAGNVTIVNTKGIVIDTTKPEITLSDVGGWQNADTTVEVTATDDLSGISTVSYTTDELVPQAGTVTLVNGKGSILLKNEGQYTLSVSATDLSGNTVIKTEQIKIDKTSPIQPQVQTVVDNSTKAIIGIAEPGSSVLILDSTGNIVGQATAGSDGSYTITIQKQPAGTMIYLSAIDSAGNTSNRVPILVQKLSSHVGDMIDALPNPETATDADISSAQSDIKDTKKAYDGLDAEGRALIIDAQKNKLDELVARLDALLVLKAQDTKTGVTVTGIGTAVVVDELSSPDVNKVEIALQVTPIEATSPTNSSPNIAIAATSLQGDSRQILAAFDISLLKSVYATSGDVTSSKVNNSNIVDYITVNIPIPADYIGRTDLQVVYIDDNGVVHPYDTTIVTINGVLCLQFKTNHFSEYAIVGNAQIAPAQSVSVKTEDVTSTRIWQLTLALSGLCLIMVSRTTKKRRKNV